MAGKNDDTNDATCISSNGVREKGLMLRGRGSGGCGGADDKWWCSLIRFSAHPASYARITLQQPNNGRIGFRSVDEFLQRKPPVFVRVHLPKNFLRSFFRCRFVFGHFHHRANHSIDCPDNFQHFLFRDESVSVQVVHVECPAKLVFKFSTRGHGKSTDELSKINCSIVICVKRTKDVFGKLRSIAVREETGVDVFELVDS